VTQLLDREQHRLDAIRSRPVLARPEAMIEQRETDTTALRERGTRCLGHRLDRADGELAHTLARLRALSPAATLQRGYAIVQRRDGTVVRSPAEVSPADPLRIRLAGGELAAIVDSPEE
jgi:exodeoxyribonuclease VII large subunit